MVVVKEEKAEELLQLFLKIGLDERTAKNTIANNKVTSNLTAVINEVLYSIYLCLFVLLFPLLISFSFRAWFQFSGYFDVALFWYRNNCDELVIFISGCCYWRVWPKNREFTLYGKLFEHWFTFAWFLLVKNLLDSGNAGMILLIYFFFVFFTVKLEELKKFKFNTVKFRLFFIWEFGLLELLEWYI